jgi:tripartite-type tricarboxylate transporter receptor subunit TctC
MKTRFRHLKTIGMLLASAALLPLASPAAAWPDRAIRIIIPWAPGGSTDIVGRILAADLTARLKQQVIIDNRPGAGSILGLQLASQSPPDGHNFMMTSTAYGHLIQKSSVDLVKSFESVAMIGLADSALVVNPHLPVNSVKDLIALAKKRPGELLYSSSGVGGFPHMNTELFKLMTGVNLVHVPFKGGGPAIADTVAGHTQLQIGSLPTVIAHVRANKLKAIAVGGPKRNPALPGIPTISESGVPGYETYIWYGLFAPRNTPTELVSRMHAAINTSLDNPDVAQKMAAQGADAQKMSPAQFGKLMASETAKWQDVITRAGIKGE